MQLTKFQNKKVVIILFIALFFLWFLLWKIMIYFEKKVVVVSDFPSEYFVDSTDYLFYLDEKRNFIDDDRFIVRGWFFKKGIDIQKVSMHIVLHDLKANKWLILPTAIVKTQNVTDYFHDGHNYNYSGFYTNISRKYLLDKKNMDYRYYMLYQLNNEEKKLVSIDK